MSVNYSTFKASVIGAPSETISEHVPREQILFWIHIAVYKMQIEVRIIKKGAFSSLLHFTSCFLRICLFTSLNYLLFKLIDLLLLVPPYSYIQHVSV